MEKEVIFNKKNATSTFDSKLVLLSFIFYILLNFLYLPLSYCQELSWQHYDSLRISHLQKNQPDSALLFAKMAIDKAKIEVGEKDYVYADMISYAAGIYFNTGNHTKAIYYYEKECSVRENLFYENPVNYINCLNRLALVYRRTGQNDKSKETFLKAIEYVENSIGKEHSVYGSLLNSFANLKYSTGNYNKALALFLEASENIKNSLGEHDPLYSTTLNNLAGIYTIMGQYDKALPMYLEALDITEKTLGKKHSTYAIRLNSLAQLYLRLGQYNRALPLFKEAIKITEETLGKENTTYSVNLNNLASLYRLMGEYNKALPLFYEAVEVTEKIYGKDHPEYGNRINNLAGVQRFLGNYDEAIALYREALEIVEKNFGKEHSVYSSRLNNLASMYVTQALPDKALPLYKEALEITERTLGKSHPNYGICLINLANAYDFSKSYSEAYPLYMSSFENNLVNLDRAFTFLSEKEKEDFIKTVNSDFNYYQSFLLRYNAQNPAVGADAYNIGLATKGMILQSGIEMRESILNSGDSTALEKYDQWVQIRTRLSKQYSLPLTERTDNIDYMEQKAERLEGELARLSNTFDRVNRLTNVKWQDVQAKLAENEAAIEFVSFDYTKDKNTTDSVFYVALLTKKESEHPVLIPLFERKELEVILGQTYNNSFDFINSIHGTINRRTSNAAMLYELIWKPMESYLEDVTTIYYSPGGLLHKVSLAALSTAENEFLCDIYNFNLVSSTSQIRKQDERFYFNDPVFFGGILYNGPETIKEVWSFLPGTLTEIEKIAGMLKKSGVESQSFTGINATESKFKEVAQNSGLLHIATHGFFYPCPDDMIAAEQERIIHGAVEFRGDHGFGVSSFMENPNPLMRSGLVFAGANDAWNATTRNIETDDGVLTAHEVANMNLHNTQLVVLSACETGLGDIRGSEGVYGLQRAFKMAGVDYIIMSLWQVPDKETVEFMEIFYTKLLDHRNIRIAFNETQREMRQNYDPFFWAAFVLIE